LQRPTLQRPAREVQKSFILPSSEPVAALQQVQAHTVRRIAQRYISNKASRNGLPPLTRTRR